MNSHTSFTFTFTFTFSWKCLLIELEMLLEARDILTRCHDDASKSESESESETSVCMWCDCAVRGCTCSTGSDGWRHVQCYHTCQLFPVYSERRPNAAAFRPTAELLPGQ